MRPGVVRITIAGLLLLAAFVACVGDDPEAADKPTGDEGGACFTDGACNPGLVCQSSLCVRPPPGGTDAAIVSAVDSSSPKPDAGTDARADEGDADAEPPEPPPDCSDAGPCGIPGLVAWFRADRGVVIDGGNAVWGWKDQSPKGNHATLGVDAMAPIFRDASSVFDGAPVIEFNRTISKLPAQRLVTPVFADVAERTIFVVLSHAVSGRTEYFVDGVNPEGQNAMAFQGTNALIGGGSFVTLNDFEPDGAAPFLFEGVFAGATSKLRINDSDAHFVEDDVGDQPMNGLTIGASRAFAKENESSNTFNFEGAISEILVYDRVLTDAQRAHVLKWLRSRYSSF